MRSRSGIAIAMTALLGATAMFVVNVHAQQPDKGGSPTEQSTSAQPQRRQSSPEARAAFIDTHIAAAKAALKLTADQENLWPAVEQSAREAIAQRADMRRAMQQQQSYAADPVARMRSIADASIARGETMRKVADAVQPLFASLDDTQKSSLKFLMSRSGVPMQTSSGRDDDRGNDRMRPRGYGGSDRFDDRRGMGGRGDDRDDRASGRRGDERNGYRDRDERNDRGMNGSDRCDPRDRDRGRDDRMMRPRFQERFDRGDDRGRREMMRPRDDNRYNYRGDRSRRYNDDDED